MNGRTIRGVVFDFDGTLFDATDAICHSFNAALETLGRPPLPRAGICRMIGRPLVDMYAETVPGASRETLDRLVEAYRRVFHPVCLSMCRALPGLHACLDALADRCRLGIATNRGRRGAFQILDGFGVRDRFAAVVGLEDVERTKPHPEAVETAMARMGTCPEETAMVGDTPEDMAAGRAAGALAVGVTTGHHDARALRDAGADAVLPGLAGLPELLAGPGAAAPPPGRSGPA